MNRLGRILLPNLALALIALQQGCSGRDSAPTVKLEARRDFGYTVGSLVEHRVTVDLPPSASVDPNLLPGPGPVNDWLDLRSVRWSTAADDRLTLDLTYLILRGTKSPEPVAIPSLTLSLRHGDGVTELQTPEWAFTLMPVIPPGLADEKIEVRGMHRLPASSVATERWVLTLALLGAGVCAFLIALRRGVFPSLAPPPPFTAALREFGRPRFSMSPAERYTAGLQRIHRAIDQTAGIAVFPANVPEFLEHHPAFRPLRAEFEQFFETSQRHFFAAAGTETGGETGWQQLVEFCRRCARAERGLR